MRISNARDLGLYVRDRRHALHLTQNDLATAARVSRRWLLDLEAGKPSAQVGLVLQTLHALQLAVDIRADLGQQELDLDRVLDSLLAAAAKPEHE